LRIELLSQDPENDTLRPVHLDLGFTSQLGTPPEPYELLLKHALIGDRSLFTREDAIEETWRIVDPLLTSTIEPISYLRGSAGPPQAEALLNGYTNWQRPWLKS
ncbi:MAG: glucose-6-phosphate dehydrogenase, partial [Acidimicrobiales bacterium]